VAKRPKKAAVNNAHPLDEEANDRLSECRTQKSAFELDMRECYFFTAPLRARQISSSARLPSTPMHDDGFLQTSAGFEVAGDFVTEASNTFMPQAEQWCERSRGLQITEGQWKQVETQVRDGDKQIFEAIKGSGFYAEWAKAAYPDLSIGTMALFITDPNPTSSTIRTMAVPLRELEIALGPFGDVDDRFIVRFTKNRYIKALLPGIPIPEDIAAEIDKNGDHETEVRWGYWRLWEEIGDETWQHVAMIKDRVVHSARLKGEGCCPLIVSRFNATADWAYGLGPTMTGLPELRQIDELEGQKINHIELNLSPPIFIPDDSFAAVEQGLEPGMAYPIRAGSEKSVVRAYEPGPPEAGVYLIDDKVRRLRKHFYVDYPEQRGDTPPTLGQWMDELARAQRRIGTPALTFWQEGPAQIFLRFKYLLEQRGILDPIRVNGNIVALRAINPAQRAAEQQEIATAVRAIQILGGAFPEEFKAFIDGQATMKAFTDKMRVTLLKYRDKQQVDEAVNMIAKLIAGRHPPTADPAQAAGLP
jgi:hypothetical protein